MHEYHYDRVCPKFILIILICTTVKIRMIRLGKSEIKMS